MFMQPLPHGSGYKLRQGRAVFDAKGDNRPPKLD